jgi:hypothetical protein
VIVRVSVNASSVVISFDPLLVVIEYWPTAPENDAGAPGGNGMI